MSTAEEPTERFTEEELAGEVVATRTIGGAQPTFTDLKYHLERYGPEGVLESAVHLSEDQYEQLAKLVRKQRPVTRVVGRRRVKSYV